MLDSLSPTLQNYYHPMGASKDITILVAEDNDDSRAMLRTFLELQGFRVVEASNGEDAVKLACNSNPDLILMDLNMPNLDGLSASVQIRQVGKLMDVPIITNSASGKSGMEFFLNLGKLGDGYLEYIPKPFDLEGLAKQIKTILRKTKKT